MRREETDAPDAERDAEWETLRRAANGDEEAFVVVVERNQQRLERVCRGILGDPDQARDAVQEVFLRAYRKGRKTEPRGRLYTWLYRIAVNLCLNRLRRRRVVSFLQLSVQEETATFEPVDTGPVPDRVYEARERWARTRERIELLPPSQRAVLVLAKFEGLSYRQIAAALDISVSAVEGRLFRAMRALERDDREAG